MNLPHWLALSKEEAATLALPRSGDDGDGAGRYASQHARWCWLPLEQAAREESVHPYVRVYAQWLRDNAG